ncbi:GYDIA family GHMP kinase [Winogradskyella maritima]|uniref:GYDIA family GHMP kinase n=1 Tax=Winogradskyella maritima TaxID=1517766 RepID=A0ABV8AFY0_9FLAO|nr:GYDIA family GHMP kinase [Winogradskyella maritima]
MPKHFKSHGKLLLTGEYVVLDGAKALAIPTTYSQTLEVSEQHTKAILWKSYDETESLWFEGAFQFKDGKFKTTSASDGDVAQRLVQILKVLDDLNPKIFQDLTGVHFKTTQDFNRRWGLGTSSTLINNLADWANIDAYALLQETFGGSGYDIACAQQQSPLIYRLDNGEASVESVDFNPEFKEHLYFVYLNEKKNSRDGIAYYKTQSKDLKAITEISAITEALLDCTSFETFKSLLETHEDLISKLTRQHKVSDQFKDFNGTLKSLGAWGGDFVLACSNDDPTDYFKNKGFTVVIPYADMVL